MKNKIKPEKLDKKQRAIVDLTLGKEPKTEDEKQLFAEIAEIKSKGRIVDLPFD